MEIGETKTFNYTGNIQSIVLMPGQYKLECWGAGGGNDNQRGGYGGYSYGHININQQQTLYICVGGAGASAASGRGGGYNGGGNAGGSGSSGAGGGATHIALTNRGILSNYNSYRSEIILVAGAGGGGGNFGSNTIGGNGGGLSGQQAGASGIATQTSGNAFGQGGHRYGDGGGGGGGWYGGYAAAGDNGGGGGSSYYNTSKLYDYGTTSGVVPNTQHGHVVVTCILLFTGDSKVNFLLQDLNQTDYFTTESFDYFILTSDDINNIPYKKYDGFTLDNSLQQIYYNNDLQKIIVNCYYTRNSYNLILENGTSQKYTYLYEEQGDLHYDRHPIDSLHKFKNWISDVPANIDLVYLHDTFFKMPASDVTISVEFVDQDRVNTNIYKNIFDSFLFDLYNFQTILNGPYKQETTIFQYNHKFQVYDLLRLNQSSLYEKGIAIESKYDVIGMVTQVLNDHEFVLTTYGPIETNLNFTSDSGVLYLSDTQEGKFCTYEELETNFYTPIGFYTGNTITLNILDSSVGDTLKKYNDTVYEHEQDLPHITVSDKQDIIQGVLDNAW